MYGPCRDRVGLAARILSVVDRSRKRYGASSSGRYFHSDQGEEPDASPFETRPLRSLSWSFYLTNSARAMHTSSGNLGFRPSRYNVLDFRDIVPPGRRSILSSPDLSEIDEDERLKGNRC